MSNDLRLSQRVSKFMARYINLIFSTWGLFLKYGQDIDFPLLDEVSGRIGVQYRSQKN